jgi:hypothetical protein
MVYELLKQVYISYALLLCAIWVFEEVGLHK